MWEIEPMKRTPSTTMGILVAMGIIIGTAVGVFTDDLGLWLALGLIFGIMLGSVADKRERS